MCDQQPKKRMKSLFSFYKKESSVQVPASNSNIPMTDQHQPDLEDASAPNFSTNEVEFPVDASKEQTIQTDPGRREPIYNFPVNQQDRIRKEYVQLGPCQPKLEIYPPTFDGRYNRRFQYRWFSLFPWLEYSVATDKNVSRKKGVCEQHGGHINSFHQKNVQNWVDLSKISYHIDRVIDKLPPEVVRNNRLRLKTTIAVVKYLGKQGLPFRGHDESSNSCSRGHFIEIIKSYIGINDEIAKVVLENAPKDAMYIAPSIQKEILDIIATKIRNKICREIGDVKYCILVDESLDVSHKEQMAIIIIFIDEEGFVRERFFEIISVKDTTSLNLKKHVCLVLSTNKLQVQNISGQGYDGASNMRDQFHGLKILFLQEYPFAYYVHCFAHRLQLALNACARDVPDMHIFFQMLSSIVNFIGSSSKRTNMLKDIQEAEYSERLADGDLET